MINKYFLVILIILISGCQASNQTKGDGSASFNTSSNSSTNFTVSDKVPRLALVIGNSNYQKASWLANPLNDANDMAAVLRSLNFNVILKKDIFCFSRCGFYDEQAAEIASLKKQQAETIAQCDAKIASLEAQLRDIKQLPIPTRTPTITKPTPEFSNNLVAGKVFQDRLKDGSLGPKMVVIPAGSFRMGDIQGGGDSDEQPVHRVSVKKFAMGKYEVTVGEFRKFVNATNYKTDAENKGDCYSYFQSWKWVKGANWRSPGFSQHDNYP